MDIKAVILWVMILPFIGALISWILGMKSEKARDYFNIFITMLNLCLVTMIFPHIKGGEIHFKLSHFMGVGMDIKLDMLRYILLWMTTFIWAMVTLYSTQYLTRYKNRNRYYVFYMLTLGATSGVFLAGDILGLLMFFEVMSFTSYVLVIHDEDFNAHQAGKIYLTMAIIGGLLLLTGIFLLFENVGILNLDQITEMAKSMGSIKYTIAVLMILGFGIKAGMFPLHIWLPKAYAASPSPASAVLSGVLAKTGTFGIMMTVTMLLMDSHGVVAALLVLGFITMFLGGFFALFQTNIKRILAYSSMSQMGYIIVGIGLMGILKENGALAIQGTVYHMFNHGIFKALLFLCVGFMYMGSHILDINELKGFGRKHPGVGLLFISGFMGITGMPGFNGFVSKSLLHEALSEAHHLYDSHWFTLGEWVFTISSAMTVAYMLKIFIRVFVEEQRDTAPLYPFKWSIRIVIPTTVFALTIVFIGLFPKSVYALTENVVELLGYGDLGEHEIIFFSLANMKASFLSYGIGALIYGLGVNKFLRNKNGDYFNPILRENGLEKMIYAPVWRGLFNIGHKTFTTLEGMINRSYHMLDNMSKVSKAFKEDTAEKQKGIQLNLSDDEGLLIKGRGYGKIPSIEQIVSFSQELGIKANSITVSIYIFATMVIVLLLVFILQDYNILS